MLKLTANLHIHKVGSPVFYCFENKDNYSLNLPVFLSHRVIIYNIEAYKSLPDSKKMELAKAISDYDSGSSSTCPN